MYRHIHTFEHAPTTSCSVEFTPIPQGWSCRQANYVGRIRCGVTVHTNKNTQMHEPICGVAVLGLLLLLMMMMMPSLHPCWLALLTEPNGVGWWVREGARHIGMMGVQ